jgi:CBS domain-containing protein
MAKTIAEVMRPNPVTCHTDSQIREAAQLMRDQAIGDVVVVDDTGVRGIVTDRDLVIRGLAAGHDASARVGDVCSEGLVTLESQADVAQAVETMRSQALRRIPVVDGNQLVGIVSIGDLAMSEDPKSALADISAAPPNS